MLQEGLTAATAAVRVGNESASHFSRKFKHFFGCTPMEEAGAMKSALIENPAAKLNFNPAAL